MEWVYDELHCLLEELSRLGQVGKHRPNSVEVALDVMAVGLNALHFTDELGHHSDDGSRDLNHVEAAVLDRQRKRVDLLHTSANVTDAGRGVHAHKAESAVGEAVSELENVFLDALWEVFKRGSRLELGLSNGNEEEGENGNAHILTFPEKLL